MSDDDLKQLREQTQASDRLSPESAKTDDSQDSEGSGENQVLGDYGADENGSNSSTADGNDGQVAEAIMGALEEMEHGDKQKSLSVWDGEMSALLDALDEHPEERARLSEALQEKLGVHAEGLSDRSDIVKMLLRIGLAEADPELADTLEKVVKEHATRTL
ncbi:hypothetical protein [Haloferax volcanii]|uniref:hypothetical protein n=1 Tax=Haloferax volcanii TaxID=2246 RepID=UPI003D302A22